MVFKRLETLINAFANRLTRHNNYELAPAIPLVEFEHGLEIHVSLACTRFHFDIEAASFYAGLYHACRALDVADILRLVDVSKQFTFRKFDIVVTEACFILIEYVYLTLALAQVTAINGIVIARLPRKNIYGIFDGIGLVLLNLELEFHLFSVLSIILIISTGVTTIGFFGKCFVLPVTR